MNNTSDIGDLVEHKCIVRLMEVGFIVSIPTTKARYDLLVDKDGSIKRVQCKKINYKNKVMYFNATSSNYEKGKGRGRKQKGYINEIDIFMAYCFEINKFYIVPIEKAGRSKFTMRNTVNKKYKTMNLASDYEF